MRSPDSRRVPTLRNRVSMFGAAVIAAWLLGLTAALGVVLHVVLRQETDAHLQARAEAVASTVVRPRPGAVSVVENDADTALDAGIWVYAGHRPIERASAPAALQGAADQRAAAPGTFGTSGSTRLYSTGVVRDGATIATVVAATSLSAFDRTTAIALIGTSSIAALAILVAYAVLRLATARALRPVQSMSKLAADWAEQGRPDRFGPHQRYRELETLAHHLDAVLDRLAAVVRHERQLSGELSHELRTPLSRILSEADLLVRMQGGEAVAIRYAAQSMMTILETLLSTAKVDHARLPGTSSLTAVLTGLDRPSLKVAVQDDADALGVDAAVTARILAPILDNADRYAQGPITVASRRADIGIAIDIGNAGRRVPEHLRERVFDPGFRAFPEDEHDGAGLGLPLARRLARAADGDVAILATAEGTTVRVVLPPG